MTEEPEIYEGADEELDAPKATPPKATPPEPTPPKVTPPEPSLPAGDPLLTSWAKEAEAAGELFSITLNVGGLLVSGKLASFAMFLERTVTSIRQDGVGARAKSTTETYERLRMLVAEQAESRDEKWLPRHIHLIDVTTFVGDYEIRGAAWRGRIAQVDAWQNGGVHSAAGRSAINRPPGF